MRLIKGNDALNGANGNTCKYLEYSFEDKDIDLGISTITGRYPEEGYNINVVSKELVYVLDGSSKVCFEKDIIEINKGDAFLIEPGEKYYWETNYCVVTTTCTPAWSEEQHKIVS